MTTKDKYNYNLNRIRKFKFLKTCALLREDIRFQVWDSYISNLQHRTFKEFQDLKITGILLNCNQILRYSIETPTISEFRIDIDKELDECIEISKEMHTNLIQDKIKCNFYSSGGKGIHGHFLFSLDNLNLKYNDIKLNIDNLNKEFRANNINNKLNLDLVELRNVERSLVRKYIADYFNIRKNNDPQLYSSQIMFGLEGGTHRKTNNRKILIDITQRKDQIKEYIEKNNQKIIINENYFNEIYQLPKKCIDFVNNRLKSCETEPLIKVKADYVSTNKEKPLIKANFLDLDVNARYYTIALIKLYNLHEIKSQHNYIFYLLRLFNDIGLNKKQTLNEVNLIIDKLNLENNDSLEKQYSFAINKTGKVYYGFKIAAEKKSYTDLELITLVEQLKRIIPGDVINK